MSAAKDYASMAAAAEKRIVKTARALNACANEFEGELRPCQELLDAFYDAVEAREEIDRRWIPDGQATDTAKATDDRQGAPEIVVGIDLGAGDRVGVVVVDSAGRIFEPPPGDISRLLEVLGEFGIKATAVPERRYAGEPSPGSSVNLGSVVFRGGVRPLAALRGAGLAQAIYQDACGCPAGVPRAECEKACLRLLYI